MEAAHLYILVADYLNEMTSHAGHIVKPSLEHVDNHHKPLIDSQIEDLKVVQEQLKDRLTTCVEVFASRDSEGVAKLQLELHSFVKLIRSTRKAQIKRIKNHETGTRNSILYLNHLGEYRNLALFSNRVVKVLEELIINPDDES